MVEWYVFTGSKQTKFFLHFINATPITNPTKELDTLQQQYDLPFICSSKALPEVLGAMIIHAICVLIVYFTWQSRG